MNTHSAGIGFGRNRDLLWHELHRVTAAMAATAKTVLLWVLRRRQRRSLAELDDHMLRDIGLDRYQALREAAKPFWKP